MAAAYNRVQGYASLPQQAPTTYARADGRSWSNLQNHYQLPAARETSTYENARSIQQPASSVAPQTSEATRIYSATSYVPASSERSDYRTSSTFDHTSTTLQSRYGHVPMTNNDTYSASPLNTYTHRQAQLETSASPHPQFPSKYAAPTRQPQPAKAPSTHTSPIAPSTHLRYSANDTYSNHAANSQSDLRSQSRSQHARQNNDSDSSGLYAPAAPVREPKNTEPAMLPQTTVDPTQVYDPYHDYQRQATKRAEIERKKEDEKRKQEQSDAQNSTQQPDTVSEAVVTKKPKGRPKKPDGPSKATKRASTHDADTAAAMTLMQTANSAVPSGSGLEAEMKAMFSKMRELNAQNPELLSKLWQQERDRHIEESSNTLSKDAQSKDQPVASIASPPKSAAKKTSTKNTSGKKKDKESIKSTPKKAQQMTDIIQVQGSPTSSATVSIEQPKTKSTVWPADKRAEIATAAADILRGMPANQGRIITMPEIAAFLNLNPNYVQLCDMIEQRGFQLNKRQFANALLTAVPNINKPSQDRKATSVGDPTTTVHTASTRPQTSSGPTSEGQLNDAENRLLSGENLLGSVKGKGGRPRKGNQLEVGKDTPFNSRASNGEAAGHTVTLEAANSDLEGLEAVKQFVDRPVNAESTASQPDNKKSKSGKGQQKSRNFVIPTPVSKEELARKRTFGDLVDLTLMSDNEENIPPFKRLAGENQRPIPQQSPTFQSTDIITQSTAMIPLPNLIPVSAPLSSIVVTPQTQTLPIATGSQKSITLTTNDASKLNHDRRVVPIIQPLNKNKALRRSSYDSRTIARDVLLACNRHPEMRHLNAHLETLKQSYPILKDNQVDLNTFRWNVVDPGGPPTGSATKLQPDLIDIGEMGDDEDDESDSVLDMPHTASSNLAPSKVAPLKTIPQKSLQFKYYSKDAPGGNAGTATHTSHSDISHKRKTTHAPHGDLALRTQTKDIQHPGNAPISLAGAGMSYVALRAVQEAKGEVDSEGTPIKKRGRPVGWRKWMQKDGPGAGPITKAKPPSPQQDFKIYKCEWEDCSAELHNLVTLRRHIHKLHCKIDLESGHCRCLWKECGKTRVIQNGPRSIPHFDRIDCNDVSALKAHVEASHIAPIAWALGDGPADGVSDRDSELSDAYLSDREGRQVTPRVRMPESPQAAAIEGGNKIGPDSARSSAVRKKNPEMEARQTQFEAEERRIRLGVGIDRSGAKMVNEKRRAGFIDEPEDDGGTIVDDD